METSNKIEIKATRTSYELLEATIKNLSAVLDQYEKFSDDKKIGKKCSRVTILYNTCKDVIKKAKEQKEVNEHNLEAYSLALNLIETILDNKNLNANIDLACSTYSDEINHRYEITLTDYLNTCFLNIHALINEKKVEEIKNYLTKGLIRLVTARDKIPNAYKDLLNAYVDMSASYIADEENSVATNIVIFKALIEIEAKHVSIDAYKNIGQIIEAACIDRIKNLGNIIDKIVVSLNNVDPKVLLFLNRMKNKLAPSMGKSEQISTPVKNQTNFQQLVAICNKYGWNIKDLEDKIGKKIKISDGCLQSFNSALNFYKERPAYYHILIKVIAEINKNQGIDKTAIKECFEQAEKARISYKNREVETYQVAYNLVKTAFENQRSDITIEDSNRLNNLMILVTMAYVKALCKQAEECKEFASVKVKYELASACIQYLYGKNESAAKQIENSYVESMVNYCSNITLSAEDGFWVLDQLLNTNQKNLVSHAKKVAQLFGKLVSSQLENHQLDNPSVLDMTKLKQLQLTMIDIDTLRVGIVGIRDELKSSNQDSIFKMLEKIDNVIEKKYSESQEKSIYAALPKKQRLLNGPPVENSFIKTEEAIAEEQMEILNKGMFEL